MAIKCRGNFKIFQFASAMRRQKDGRRLNRHLCILSRQWLRHVSAFCKGLWFDFETVETTCSTKLYCLLITHLNRWKGRHYFSRWSPCFGFFVCPYYSKRTHYPTLEKPGAQNIAVCEKQGQATRIEWSLKIS